MNKLSLVDQPLADVLLFESFRQHDCRGAFSKIYQNEFLGQYSVGFEPAEIFFSRSKKDVLRGMHYQTGTASQSKLVTCLEGKVLDVVVDIRPDSPNFNKPYAIELTEDNGLVLFVGIGFAHGFLSLRSDSVMLYATSSVHQPSMDTGVLWSSIDFTWPIENPVLSLRDSSHASIHSLRDEKTAADHLL